jgi:hypothetical protein
MFYKPFRARVAWSRCSVTVRITPRPGRTWGQFFQNGGKRAFVMRMAGADIQSDKLLLVPDTTLSPLIAGNGGESVE